MNNGQFQIDSTGAATRYTNNRSSHLRYINNHAAPVQNQNVYSDKP